MSSSQETRTDPFIADKLFPDPAGLLLANHKRLDEVLNDALVVLDTNALLVPYGIGKKSLAAIRATYRKLVMQQRLVIPAQVAREFARNRPKKLGELFQQLSTKRSVNTLRKGTYPLLEGLDAYDRVKKLEEEIDRLLDQYRDAVGAVQEHIRSWQWDDPVSRMYREEFDAGVFRERKATDDDVLKRVFSQIAHKTPPGYKDGSKEDFGVGDVLIWQTILELGEATEKSVVFVSGDAKADWVHRADSTSLYPRYELVDEYRRASRGGSFHIVSFADFLEVLGADRKAVAEVRHEEKVVRLSDLSDHARRLVMIDRATMAVGAWARSEYPGLDLKEAGRGGMVDFVWSEEGGAVTGLDVIHMGQRPLGYIAAMLKRLRNVADSSEFDSIYVFLIVDGREDIDRIEMFVQQFAPPGSGLNVIFGVLGENDTLVLDDRFGNLPNMG